jgi:hypothetical protein
VPKIAGVGLRACMQSIPGQQKLMNLNGTLPGSGGVNPGRLAAATPPPFVCCPLSCWSPIPHSLPTRSLARRLFWKIPLGQAWRQLPRSIPHAPGQGRGCFFIHLAAMPRPSPVKL